MSELIPGNSVESKLVRKKSASVTRGRLSNVHEFYLWEPEEVTNISSGLVPWWETITVSKFGSYPTNPVVATLGVIKANLGSVILTVLDRVAITTGSNRLEVRVGFAVGCLDTRVISKVICMSRCERARTSAIPCECLRVCAVPCTGVIGV